MTSTSDILCIERNLTSSHLYDFKKAFHKIRKNSFSFWRAPSFLVLNINLHVITLQYFKRISVFTKIFLFDINQTGFRKLNIKYISTDSKFLYNS